MNPAVNAFQRNFVNDVKRCDEMDRRLRFLVDQLRKEEDYIDLIREGEMAMGAAAALSLDQLESRLEQEEAELTVANNSANMLERNYNELVELKHVLEKDQLFFQEAGGGGGEGDLIMGEDKQMEDAPLLGEFEGGGGGGGGGDEESFFPKAAANLGFITGVVEREKLLSFERVLWRATRGNLYLRHVPIEEDLKDVALQVAVQKDVFIIFYQGSRVEHKIRKICEAFKANLYPCPESSSERKTLLEEVKHRLEEVDCFLFVFCYDVKTVFLGGSCFETWC